MSKRARPPETDLAPRSDETLGQYLRRLRLKRNLGLIEVAERSPQHPESQHISHSYLSQLETSHATNPSSERLVSLARILDVPAEWLIEKAGLNPAVLPNDAADETSLSRQVARRAAKLDSQEAQIVLAMIEGIIAKRQR